MTATNTRIDEIIIPDYEEDIAELQDLINNILDFSDEISILQTQTTTNTTTISTLQTQNTTNSNNISTIQTQMTATNTRSDEIIIPYYEEDIAELQELINNIPDFFDEISTLQTQTITNTNNISTLQTEMTAVNTRIDEIVIPDYEEDIAELQELINNIPDFSDEISILQTQTDTNITAISTLQTQVNNRITVIDEINESIELINTTITTLQTNYSSQNDWLTTLDGNISTI
jgi:predicted  nucleic acid-binding Zn-ribbon protein